MENLHKCEDNHYYIVLLRGKCVVNDYENEWDYNMRPSDRLSQECYSKLSLRSFRLVDVF